MYVTAFRMREGDWSFKCSGHIERESSPSLCRAIGFEDPKSRQIRPLLTWPHADVGILVAKDS